MTAVTIYTDASILQGRGAWAAVILREDCERVETAGPLRGRFKSSTATEIAAIANALHYAQRAGLATSALRLGYGASCPRLSQAA